MGTWYGTSSFPITSDKNKKHEIQTIQENYSIFYDELLPVLFKYNDGTSNRLHAGFIAQDVEEALQKAEISTQDFAGLVISQENEQQNYYLRYEEFISLNTWQIQKLKPRMTAAEQKILALESEVQRLNSELENLKNSQISGII